MEPYIDTIYIVRDGVLYSSPAAISKEITRLPELRAEWGHRNVIPTYEILRTPEAAWRAEAGRLRAAVMRIASEMLQTVGMDKTGRN